MLEPPRWGSCRSFEMQDHTIECTSLGFPDCQGHCKIDSVLLKVDGELGVFIGRGEFDEELLTTGFDETYWDDYCVAIEFCCEVVACRPSTTWDGIAISIEEFDVYEIGRKRQLDDLFVFPEAFSIKSRTTAVLVGSSHATE
jgi:hypothetical protein